MKIITESIKDCIEIELNKNIDTIQPEDLKKIKELNIDRMSFNGQIKTIDYNELSYFDNLECLNIFNCPINEEFMKIIIQKDLEKIYFYNCDFIDDCTDFFNLLKVKELTIDTCLGTEDICFSNIKKLTLRNINLSNAITNIDVLDISHVQTMKTPELSKIKELIILNSNIEEMKKLNLDAETITIIDERNEKVGVYNND